MGCYDYLLQARFMMSRYGNYEKVEGPLRKALNWMIHLPKLMPASFTWKWENSGSLTGTALISTQLFALAEKALEVDKSNSYCHGAMSLAAAYSNRFDLAMFHADEALRLNPNNFVAAKNRGMWLVFLGRSDEALSVLEEVHRRDPYPPENFWEALGAAYFQLDEYEKALATFARVSDPQFWEMAYIAASHARLGRQADARDMFSRLMTRLPSITISRLLAVENYQLEESRQRLAQPLRELGNGRLIVGELTPGEKGIFGANMWPNSLVPHVESCSLTSVRALPCSTPRV